MIEYAVGDLDAAARAAMDAHLRQCRHCAGALGSILAVIPPERTAVARTRPADLPRASRSWVRVLRPWATAAAALALLTAGAWSAFRLLAPPRFVTSSAQPGETVGSAMSQTGLQFEAAGLPLESRILARAPVAAAGRTTGSVVLVAVGAEGTLDLAGFDGEGRPLWIASRDWPDYRRTLAYPGVGWVPRGLKSMVGRRTGDNLAETLVLAVSLRDRSALYLVEPRTGRRHGVYHHDGVLAADPLPHIANIEVLPAPDGVDRRILIGGAHGGADALRSCLSVIDLAGTVHQHVTIPELPSSLAPGTPLDRVPLHVRVEWVEGRERVVTQLPHYLIASFPVREGRLVIPEGTLDFDDGLAELHMRRTGAAGTLESLLESMGGRDRVLRALAADLADSPGTPATGWEDR